MLQQFDYVRITLSDGTQREGFLANIDGLTGTLASPNSNTAFHLPSTIIHRLVKGTRPVPLPTALRSFFGHTQKPYRVVAMIGTHTAYEDYVTEQVDARKLAQSLIGQWSNNIPGKNFCQFTSILILATRAQEPISLGATVRILAIDENGTEYHGLVGKYVDCNEHNYDGDFYGVTFDNSARIIYFWREEIEVIRSNENARI